MDTNNTSVMNENMPIGQINPYAMPQVEAKKPAREFSKKETAFAFVCYILSYLFCLCIPSYGTPLGAFIVVLLTYGSTFAFMMALGKKPKLMPTLVALSAVITCGSLVLTSNGFLHFFSFNYSIYAYCYFLYGMSSDNEFKFKDSIVIDFVKAMFVLPFFSFFDIFKAMFSGKKNKSGKIVAKVILGALIAVLPTAIIFALLSYDKGFTDLFDKMFTFDSERIFEHLVSLVFGVPISAYVFGLFVSSNDSKCTKILTHSDCKKAMSKMSFAPVVTVITAVLPILFVYVVFFISQWQYYISGFTGVLPKDFSYAEYAREGFFQLCVVAVINLLIIITISVFIKKCSERPSFVLKILNTVLSLCTLVLISTAMAKMYMYIDCYGLTPLRVYASWFMAVLALIFLLIIAKQFTKKLRVVVVSLSVVVVMFSSLALSNVDTFIAKYNVDRYINGTLDTVDIYAMDDLGDSAVPQLVRLAKYMDEKNGTDIHKVKADVYDDMYYELVWCLRDEGSYIKTSDFSIYEYTIPKYKAEKALDSIGLLKVE